MLEALERYGTVIVAGCVIGVVLFMVVPLPPILLDILLASSITLALTVLLVAIQVMRPLEFSAFPTMLLITTLFRLSLNIASTRLILLGGSTGTDAAGKVIEVFGAFVVGGNYVVGIILFAILVLINFVVITKGSGRIAEVAARFTLDAMPGKQMAIDADLNAGLISETDARQRRKSIQQEADFYGAMDGASKFVRGDAIAGLIIIAINIIGGFVIGVVQEDMAVADAARTYTILTVGDGLVSQIPALVISTAAGVVVSRAASEAELGKELSAQLLRHPHGLYMVALLLVGFGLLPGMPLFVFWTLAAGLTVLARFVAKPTAEAEEAQVREEESPTRPAEETEQERIESLLPVDLVEVEVGYGLVPLVDTERGGDLLERIGGLRRQFATSHGIVIPPVHVRDNLQLPSGRYVVKVKGVELAQAEVLVDRMLAMNPGDGTSQIAGIDAVEPVFGLPARWITKADREKAEALGYTVVDPSTVITTHLSEVLRQHAHELLGRDELAHLLEVFKRSHPKVVEELVPDLMSSGDVLKVLRALLKEGIAIRDLRTILETLADNAAATKSPDMLTELVRAQLAPAITKSLLTDDGLLHVTVLDRATEDAFREHVAAIDGELQLSVDPVTARRFIEQLEQASEALTASGKPAVLLVPPELRRPVVGLLSRFAPDWTVVSHREVDAATEVRCAAEIAAVQTMPGNGAPMGQMAAAAPAA